MSRIADLRGQVQRRTANVYDTLFTRRLSIYLTVLCARLGMTPNQVSALGAVTGAAACLLMAVGSPAAVLVGVGLLHLYAILDSVDGELARLRQRFTLTGLFLEDLSAYAMINAFNLAIGWRLYAQFDLMWPVVSAVAVAAFGRNVMPVARRAMLKSMLTRRPHAHAAAMESPAPQSRLREFIQENVFHTTNQWVVVSAALAAAVHGVISVTWVAILFAITISVFAFKEVVALIMMLRDDRLERELSRIYAAASALPESDGLRLSRSWTV